MQQVPVANYRRAASLLNVTPPNHLSSMVTAACSKASALGSDAIQRQIGVVHQETAASSALRVLVGSLLRAVVMHP